MKTVSYILAICLLLTSAFSVQAQVSGSSRPDLFNSFPASIAAQSSELGRVFSLAAGSSVQLNFSNNFSFSGTVLSSVQKYHNLSTVLVKSATLKNALLSISKRINDDNTVTYVGRIINEKYADGYLLVKDNSGNYSFSKIRTEDLIQDF